MNFQITYNDDQITNIILAFGPFIAALITGLIAIIVGKIQSNATLNAAKNQSDATLEALTRSLTFEGRKKDLKYYMFLYLI